MQNNNISRSKTIANLQARGIGYEIKKVPVKDPTTGEETLVERIVITSIPPEEAELNRFYSLDIDCWFNGCEQLREEYKNELAKAGTTDAPCTGCQKGAIMRLFEKRVRAAIQNSKNHATNSRTSEIPRPNAESNEGTGKSTSMLRRATEGIKKIFNLSKK